MNEGKIIFMACVLIILGGMGFIAWEIREDVREMKNEVKAATFLAKRDFGEVRAAVLAAKLDMGELHSYVRKYLVKRNAQLDWNEKHAEKPAEEEASTE